GCHGPDAAAPIECVPPPVFRMKQSATPASKSLLLVIFCLLEPVFGARKLILPSSGQLLIRNGNRCRDSIPIKRSIHRKMFKRIFKASVCWPATEDASIRPRNELTTCPAKAKLSRSYGADRTGRRDSSPVSEMMQPCSRWDRESS